MLPCAIKVRNYRSFVGEHRFKLAPLTLFYGDNNTGKSALLRALPFLADCVAHGVAGALDLDSPSLYGCGFADLLWKGERDEELDPDLGLGFEWGQEHEIRAVDYTIIRKQRRVLIRQCSMELSSGEKHELKWVPLPATDDALNFDYRRQDSGDLKRGTVAFRGLVPEEFRQDFAAEVLAPLAEQLGEFRGAVQWVAAKRRAPERKVSMPAGPKWRLEPDGRDAAQALYSLPELCGQVSDWYRAAIGRVLDFVEIPPDEFRIVLRNAKHHQALEVDLIDSGQGVIQVFPVLTTLALLRQLRGPKVLTIEEPESHLHGTSQTHLTREICRTASAAKHACIAIETHSRHVLLGVQLALLQGELRPDDIIIYWVRQDERGRSSIDAVTLDEDAYLQGVWPDPFSHERVAVRDVIEARRSRNGV